MSGLMLLRIQDSYSLLINCLLFLFNYMYMDKYEFITLRSFEALFMNISG